MRDRLAELYHNIEIEYLDYLTNIAERAINDDIEDKIQKRQDFYVDKLLANGVIVPPCKVGDGVYEIDLPEYGIIVCKVTKVLYDSEEVIINVIDGHGKGSEYYFEFDDFGKTVFLTKEEAEQALKGGEG